MSIEEVKGIYLAAGSRFIAAAYPALLSFEFDVFVFDVLFCVHHMLYGERADHCNEHDDWLSCQPEKI